MTAPRIRLMCRERLPIEACAPSTNGHKHSPTGMSVEGASRWGKGKTSAVEAQSHLIHLLQVFAESGSNWLKTELIICEEWGIGYSTFRTWKIRAGKLMKEQAIITAEQIVNADLFLYERCIVAKNYAVCSQVNTRLAKMAGLYIVRHKVEVQPPALDSQLQAALIDVGTAQEPPRKSDEVGQDSDDYAR